MDTLSIDDICVGMHVRTRWSIDMFPAGAAGVVTQVLDPVNMVDVQFDNTDIHRLVLVDALETPEQPQEPED